MDGARIFNAAAALGMPVREIAAPADTVMFCLSKALGAPAGSMLAGPADLIAKGRLYRKRLGGGMRQAGVLAAAGLVALEESPAKLPDDHANARFLAEGLARIPGIQIDPAAVETNIVVFDVRPPALAPADISARLKAARRPDQRHQRAPAARRDALRRGPGAVRPGPGSGRRKYRRRRIGMPLKRHNGISPGLTTRMLRFSILLLAGTAALAQQYTISTVAGGAPPATPVAALSTSIGQPRKLAISGGNLYFSSGNSVFKIDGSGTLTLVAGNSRAGFSGDGGPAVNAQLNAPQGLALDSAGNLYIADSLNNRVRMVNTTGVITTFAGNGTVNPPGFWGDGGPATNASLHLPTGVAVDSAGNVYIADTGDNTIREVTTDGIINIFAG